MTRKCIIDDDRIMSQIEHINDVDISIGFRKDLMDRQYNNLLSSCSVGRSLENLKVVADPLPLTAFSRIHESIHFEEMEEKEWMEHTKKESQKIAEEAL